MRFRFATMSYIDFLNNMFTMFEEAAQLAWWTSVEDADALPMKTQAFGHPSLHRMTLSSGKDFRAALAEIQTGDEHKHFKVLASLRKVDLKFGPLYYDGCGDKGVGDRTCKKRLDAGGECPSCGRQPAEVVPVLMLNRAGFESQDGATFRLTAFDGCATQLIGIDGQEAKLLEDDSVEQGDPTRNSTLERIKHTFGKLFELGVTVSSIILEDGKPYLSAKIFAVAEAESSKVSG